LEERIEIVRAIRFVDEVVVQTSMDKLAAWEKLHFDVLFHGDDWKGSSMYNEVEQRLTEHDVHMVFLPHTKGTSSTLLAEKLRDVK
jgi:glycerol-3-phosphate cytidylyltransferase